MSFPRESNFILFGLSQKEYSWRGIYYLAVLFLGSILFAAIITPWIYSGFEIWNKLQPNPTIQYILGKGIDKTFDRIRWLPTLLLLPLLLWRIHLSNAQKLGIAFQWKNIKRSSKWIVAGAAIFAVTAIIQYYFAEFNLRIRSNNPGEVLTISANIILKGLFAALIIGVLEEIIFRGMIFRFFYTAIRPEFAIVLSALFFSWTHFKDVPKEIIQEGFSEIWTSGFVIGFWTLFGFIQTLEWTPFLNLFLSGVILNLIFLKTRSLWPCIGLHAGWVWALKLHRDFFRVKEETKTLWSGSHGIIDGLLATSVLILGVIILGFLIYRKYETTSTSSQRVYSSNA